MLQMQAKHKSAARSRLQRIEADTEARFDNLTEALIRLPGIANGIIQKPPPPGA
ncbi:MAG: hypothetical protein GY953_04565 [bacterium]|nr:hypothetical protein [bacterium]